MTSPYCLLMTPQNPSQRWSLTTSVSKLNAEDGEAGAQGGCHTTEQGAGKEVLQNKEAEFLN